MNEVDGQLSTAYVVSCYHTNVHTTILESSSFWFSIVMK